MQDTSVLQGQYMTSQHCLSLFYILVKDIAK